MKILTTTLLMLSTTAVLADPPEWAHNGGNGGGLGNNTTVVNEYITNEYTTIEETYVTEEYVTNETYVTEEYTTIEGTSQTYVDAQVAKAVENYSVLNTQFNAGIAMAGAGAFIDTLPMKNGNYGFGIGVAHYYDQTGISAMWMYRTQDINYRLGVMGSQNSKPMLGGGLSFVR